MVITGITTDGAFVFDNKIDSRGRIVLDAGKRILEDGTHYDSSGFPYRKLITLDVQGKIDVNLR